MWNPIWNNWIIYVSQARKLSIMPVNNCILKYVKKRQKPLCRFFYLASEAWIVCRILWKVKNELKMYIITYVTLGLTFLSLMSAYWWKNYILNFKKLISLTLRDTLKRTQKVISNQNLFRRFQSWCWFWCWSWCLNFVSKNQAIWLAFKILGLQSFSLQQGRLG